MRQCEHGETMTIIYLKLQLEALETDGVISLGGFGDTPEEELSLLIDEEPALIKQTLDFLVKLYDTLDYYGKSVISYY